MVCATGLAGIKVVMLKHVVSQGLNLCDMGRGDRPFNFIFSADRLLYCDIKSAFNL